MIRRAFLAALLATGSASALGRIPFGGSLRLKIPWPVDALDPHAIDDATAALFGAAIADTLFALDAQGRPYPALAAKLPEKLPTANPSGTRITLRPNLRTALGRALDARDLIFSMARSARSGGAALLAPLGAAKHDPTNAYACIVPAADPDVVARALASPVTAIVPRGFNRQRPDGTGAFVAEPGRAMLRLRRNLHAARGAAFLERIEIGKAADLRDPLRSFESGEIDASWIEQFLHRPRPGAVKLSAGPFGWVVLHTGKSAGAWGAPGVAQRLLDAIPASRLAHLGLRSLGSGSGDPAWGGPASELLVADDAPHLAIIARELAAILGRPGREVTVALRSRGELAQHKASGRFSLLLGFARRIGAAPTSNLHALLTAADPALAKHPPKLTTSDARRIGETLPLGVVGELYVSGAQIPALRNLSSWDLGSVWRK
jgi:peptide/nickel transport system substrate-binding protein